MAAQDSAASTEVIHEIFALFREKGDRFYGENVTERMHALQCAALAEADGQPPELIAACLLHDIGHLLHDKGEDIARRMVDAKHEDLGDAWLRDHFPPAVTEPVRLHVDAKRYLSTVDPEYRARLTEASALSLELQGGLMSDDEAAAFERGEHFDACVQLRRYDDLGKDPSIPEHPIEHYRPVLEAVLSR